jgi:hypothetical protein
MELNSNVDWIFKFHNSEPIRAKDCLGIRADRKIGKPVTEALAAGS